jgi:outer membrane protein OmpA-like peptidoglycan-associated protein
MANKVRVYGKAQNRTALGIAHAYMVMYPTATLDDLRKAFPNELNPDKGTKENFIYAEEKGTTADWDGYFKAEDELLTMGDGKKVSVVKMWTKPSFDRIVSHAKMYDIEIAQFEAADKGGKKGGFRLEYLNGYIPPVPARKKSMWWLWLIIVLALIGVAAFLALRPKEVIEVEKVVEVEKIVEVEKVVYVDHIEEIEKNFNAATFIVGKADLSDDAKFVLHDLVQLMEKHPEIKLKLEGHTSSEGNPEFNQKLSEARAQAAVDFLVSRGIAAERLKAEGKGSSEPIDKNVPEANSRTEFIIIE